jgi:hypothetical protein
VFTEFIGDVSVLHFPSRLWIAFRDSDWLNMKTSIHAIDLKIWIFNWEEPPSLLLLHIVLCILQAAAPTPTAEKQATWQDSDRRRKTRFIIKWKFWRCICTAFCHACGEMQSVMASLTHSYGVDSRTVLGFDICQSILQYKDYWDRTSDLKKTR